MAHRYPEDEYESDSAFTGDDNSSIVYTSESESEEEIAVESDSENDSVSTTEPQPIMRGRGRGRPRGRGAGAPRMPRTQRANVADWTKTAPTTSRPTFIPHAALGPVGAPLNIDVVVDLFLTPKLLTMIVEHTNRRAYLRLSKADFPAILKDWQAVTRADVFGYLSICIYMGIVQLPSTRDYWSSDQMLHMEFCSSVMSRDAFEKIKYALSVECSDSTELNTDKLFKVRAFLDEVALICRKNYVCHQALSLDEAQAQCGHKYARCSYRRETKKPFSDYLKIITINESSSAS